MLFRSGRVLVTEAGAIDVLREIGRLPFETVVFIDSVPPGGEELAGEVIAYVDAVRSHRLKNIATSRPTDLAGILYTSGSTGRSKAVLLPHNVYCRGAARVAAAWGWTAEDVFHAWLPLFHIAGQMHQTMSMIVVGGSIAQFQAFSRSRFWEQVHESGATIVCGLANVLHLWARTPASDRDRQTTLRSVISAAIPPDLHRQLEQRFGIRIMEQYGMTEGELLTLPHSPDEVAPLGSCGRAGPDFNLAILDGDDLPLPAGSPGEIAVRPKARGLMMLGYDGDESETVRAWRNLWFHTGDMGYLDPDGYLFYVDRRKHVIRRRSENISSFELERTLAGCPGIAECAAVGVPSPLGEEDVKVVVTLQEPGAVTAREIHDFCAAHMARFMVPRYIEIVPEMPRNHVGKIEKEKLRSLPTDVWDAEAELHARRI